MQNLNSPELRKEEHRFGFTLLELMVVIVLMAIVAIIGGTSYIAYKDRVDLDRTIHAIARADRRERQVSRTSPVPGLLEIDPSEGRLQYKNARQEVTIPNRMKLISVWTTATTNAGRNVGFSITGQSHSYAIGIRTPRGSENWIVVLGLSGQIRTTMDRKEAQAWIQLGSGT